MNMINSHSVHPLNRYIGQVLPSSSNENISPPTRTRITRACDHCQLRKTKCDSMKPRCSQCIKRNDPCTFTTKVCKRGPKPKRHSYLYLENRETRATKATNVCPYPNILSTSNNQQYRGYNDNNNSSINTIDCADFRKTSYPILHKVYFQQYSSNSNSMEHNLCSTSNYYPLLQNSEFQKLPPIQLIKSSSPLQQNFEQYRGENLRLPSLSRRTHNRLPSISALLRDGSDSKLRSYGKQTSESNSSIYEIMQRDLRKPVNSVKYYNHNIRSRNAYLKELY